MKEYQVSLGKNASSLKKVYLSLPSGIIDLKSIMSGKIILTRDAYIYSFSRGLKDLINSDVVIVNIKDKQDVAASSICFISRKTSKQPALEQVEQTSEYISESNAQASALTEEEQPKKKSKKKK